jgi:hypothetical protein
MNLKELDGKKLAVIWGYCNANPELKRKIEEEFKLRRGNPKFSKQYLFSINKIGNRALIIHFLPNTSGYLKYGECITVDLVLDDEEAEQLQITCQSKPPVRTYGLVKSKLLIRDSFLSEQRKELLEKGFDCADISIVEYD